MSGLSQVSAAEAQGGKKSEANSSETALGSSESFNGAWEINEYGQALVNVLADQSGTVYTEIGIPRSDGTVTTTFSGAEPVYANVPYVRVLVKGAGRAYRTRFVNDSSAQSSFDLITTYGNDLFPISGSSDNEVFVTETERERDVFVAIQRANINADNYSALIDLSDTTNFPHDRVGRVDITNAYFSIDRDSSATGSARIGVITRIDGTDADVFYVAGVTFEKSDERNIIRDRKYSPSQLKCSVVDGSLNRILTGFSETGITAINTGVALDSPIGSATVTPAVGDIVVVCKRGAGTFNASVSVTYHGERSV